MPILSPHAATVAAQLEFQAMSSITPSLLRTKQEMEHANSVCVAATSYVISVQYGSQETYDAAYADYLKAYATAETAEAAYIAALAAA